MKNHNVPCEFAGKNKYMGLEANGKGKTHIFIKPLLKIGSPAVVIKQEIESLVQIGKRVVRVVEIPSSRRY